MTLGGRFRRRSGNRTVALTATALFLAATMIAAHLSGSVVNVHAQGLCPPNGSPAANDPARNNFTVSNYFDGWETGITDITDIQGYLQVREPYVAPVTGYTDRDVAWVMLAGVYSNDTYFAQVGWWYGVNYDQPVTFTEQGTNNTGALFIHYFGYGNLYDGLSLESMVQYVTVPDGSHDFVYYSGGNAVDSWTATFSPNQGQNFGEIHVLASAMPGESGGDHFNSVQIYRPSLGGWVNIAGTLFSSNGTYWGAGSDGSSNAWIWDNDCHY